MHPVLLLAALIVALLGFSWFKRLPPKRRRKLGFQGVLIGLGVVLLFLMATGRLHPLFALIAGLLPFVHRLIGLWNLTKTLRSLRNLFSGAATATGGAGPSAGKTSSVRTRYFNMTLEHDSGAMDAEVLQGDFAGRTLSAMSLPELQQLLAQVQRDDPESAQLLTTWLSRRYGEPFQDAQSGGEAQTNDAMSSHKAREILGLAADAEREQIILAHRRLMQKLHPDRGGSDYLAREINLAKKVLLSACDGGT